LGEYGQLFQNVRLNLRWIGHTSRELLRRPRNSIHLLVRPVKHGPLVDRGVTLVMRWFRANRRFSGTLALFALALQFTLAFGHIHLREFAGVPGVAAAQTLATTADPTGNNSTGHSADDYCLICATTNLAGTLVLPDLVALPVPVQSTDTSYAYVCSAVCGRIDHALFRARAPPLA